MVFPFPYVADEPSWTASVAFLHGDYIGCTDSFSNVNFGTLVYVLKHLYTLVYLESSFDRSCIHTMLTLLITVVILYVGGGNQPAVAVPLVALGTQNGTIDVIDVSANAVASSLSVHNGVVRGLRWLGNSKLVSFSYTQVNFKFFGTYFWEF